MPRQEPRVFTECAVRLATESLEDHGSEWDTIRQMVKRLAVPPETECK